MSALIPEPMREDAEPSAACDAAALEGELQRTRASLSLAEAERRIASDKADVLRGELQHQVRNMLAIVRSIFSRTVAAGGSLEEVADHFRGRLDAIARYQSLRASDPMQGIDFERQIVREELHSFQFGDDPKIVLSGPEVRLCGDTAQTVGLAIHELVTNSIKFGALSTPSRNAHLEICWRVTGDRLDFEWQEHGVPMVAIAPSAHGFGRELIEQGLPYQIGAETSFALQPGGILCRLRIPLGEDCVSGDTMEQWTGSLGADRAFP
jgi:two-component sensor histidine kinase